MKNLAFIALMAISLLVSCKNKSSSTDATAEAPAAAEPVAAAEAPASGGKTWVLASFGDPAGPTAVSEGLEVTLQMDMAANRVSGKAACNNFNGSFTSNDDGLQIGNLATTKMACPDPAAQMETTFLELLAAANNFEIKEGQLIMTTSTGQQLVFNAR